MTSRAEIAYNVAHLHIARESTMSRLNSAILEKEITYTGEGMSVRKLETMIDGERTTQNTKVSELKELREKNVEMQKALEDEVSKLRKLSDYVSKGELGGGFWSNVKEVLSYIPGLKNLAITQRSIEELLRQQYEISARRVKEAAEFADRLEVAERELYDEIDRLNAQILESARNESTAADYVLELNALITDLDTQLGEVEDGSVESHELTSEKDKARRVLSEHSTQFKLYHTAEERLGRLKESTRMLSETIANLRSDISQYVMAAGEKLDLVAGQLRAIGTAADASVVMLELKKSLDSMSESLNQTTRFVSETQAYFRENLDGLLQDLDVYDDETRSVLQTNLELARAEETRRIAEAVELANAYKEEHAGDAP